MKTIDDNPPEEKDIIKKLKNLFKKNQNTTVLTWQSPEIQNIINKDKISFTQKEYDTLVKLFHSPLPNELRKDVF